MAGLGRTGKGPIAAINVTPLVDVVLVLLIIFMVTTEMLHEDERAIPIDLPTAAASDTKKKAAPFTVVVTKEGKYIKDGAPATEADVIEAARIHVAEKGETAEAVVAADKAASHEYFVRLLDVLRQVGISRFAIQTDVTQ